MFLKKKKSPNKMELAISSYSIIVPIDIDQIIRTNESVSQNVFFAVFSSFLILVKMLTRFKQKIIPSIGMK